MKYRNNIKKSLHINKEVVAVENIYIFMIYDMQCVWSLKRQEENFNYDDDKRNERWRWLRATDVKELTAKKLLKKSGNFPLVYFWYKFF